MWCPLSCWEGVGIKARRAPVRPALSTYNSKVIAVTFTGDRQERGQKDGACGRFGKSCWKASGYTRRNAPREGGTHARNLVILPSTRGPFAPVAPGL